MLRSQFLDLPFKSQSLSVSLVFKQSKTSIQLGRLGNTHVATRERILGHVQHSSYILSPQQFGASTSVLVWELAKEEHCQHIDICHGTQNKIINKVEETRP